MTDAHRVSPKDLQQRVVFILDDEAEYLLDYLREALQPKGITVRWARTLEDGARIAEHLRRANVRVVVILDMILPRTESNATEDRVDMNAGFLFWHMHRDLPNWQFVALTARARPVYREHMMSGGVVWLTKPCFPSELVRAVETAFATDPPNKAVAADD
jgi:CheY-like chemotaxis protein